MVQAVIRMKFDVVVVKTICFLFDSYVDSVHFSKLNESIQ